jgi:hypothetical protein
MAASFTSLKDAGVGTAVVAGAGYAAYSLLSAAPNTAQLLSQSITASIQQGIDAGVSLAEATATAGAEAGIAFTNVSADAINATTEAVSASISASIDAGVAATGPAVAAGSTAAAGAGVAGSSAGTAGAAAQSASGYIQYWQAIMAALSVVGFARLEGQPDVTIDGEPATKKVGFIQAIKNIVSGAINTIKNLPKTLLDNVKGIGATTEEAVAKVSSYTVGAIATAAAVAAYLQSSSGSAGSTAAAASTISPGATLTNPAGTALGNNLAAIQFYATNTTTDWLTNTPALFWSTCTSTTVVGYEWWNIQQKFASTASGSYFQVLALAKGFTDALSGVSSSDGVMTIRQIIDAGSTSTGIDYVATGVIIPNVPDYAGTLYYPEYINSATTALANVILAGDTSTTTLIELRSVETILDNSIANLLVRITKDANNQAKYLSQVRHLENVMSVASVFNSIKVSQPSDIVALYESTINPGVKDAINKLNTMMDLQSNNTSTVIAALETIAATPIPTFNTVKLVNGITIMGVPATIARGRQFIVVITSGPKYGSASYTIRAPLATSGSTPLDNNGTGQFVFEFSTTRPVGTTNVDLSFSDGTTTTFAVTLV